MAGDTRDSASTPSPITSHPQPRGPPPGETSPPPHVQSPPKIYEVFTGPPPNANALPQGSGQNTAGGHAKMPTLSEGIKTVRLEDFKQMYMYPCVRESLLMGIGGGFGMGGIRALWGARIPKAANWAVGTFIFAAFANYEFCQYRRMIEKAHMKRAVEIIDRKKAEKEAAAQAKREERRRLKEEADNKAEESGNKSRWRFW
ncbi:Cytochrome c oxidase protein 20, mitochondrial [Venustampulla echinocandica]|uniref:Cytochrome c oxidase assembly protein COX20, mitochondrial n=1 Tax=Venustampulla echinocandica TaxID=2656787 RepID=A0A370TDY2_9HELO|nr:Cytochrome c oxidase protein 20, mitochondrial [Venustampulla echinocandica]RDL32669.1 Cytochrome c oxidase protein 20, mitochondrial [Venustampulla echinocandica]